MMWSPWFWRDTAERAAKTFAQGALAVLGATGLDLVSAPWWAAVSAGGFAAVLSVLSSLVSSVRADPETASALTTVVAARPAPRRGQDPEGWAQSQVDHPSGTDAGP